jgi:hypothetical protein
VKKGRSTGCAYADCVECALRLSGPTSTLPDGSLSPICLECHLLQAHDFTRFRDEDPFRVARITTVVLASVISIRSLRNHVD